MADYYTLITNTGKQKLATAVATNIPLNLSEIAIGDGGGTVYNPGETATALLREVYRAEINNIYADPENADRIIVEALMPAGVGGWYIREAGIFDTAGDLICVAKFPETYKPLLAEGSGKDLYIKIVMIVGNATLVNLTVEAETVLASRQYVVDMVAVHEAKNNPHPIYLTEPEGNGLYDPLGIALSTINAHESDPNPHPQYTPTSSLKLYFYGQI